jgi:hypothetical protein
MRVEPDRPGSSPAATYLAVLVTLVVAVFLGLRADDAQKEAAEAKQSYMDCIWEHPVDEQDFWCGDAPEDTWWDLFIRSLSGDN